MALCNCVYTQAALGFLAGSFMVGLGGQRVKLLMFDGCVFLNSAWKFRTGCFLALQFVHSV
jgi:hypothetical protein